MSSAKKQNEKLKKRAASVSITVAVLLCFIKGLAFLYTDSLAVLSSMIDSLSDIMASVVTLFAVRISTKPASSSYRYGYGKVESLSALFQAGFIAAAGLFILYDAVIKIWHPTPLQQTPVGILVMIICMLSSIFLVIYQRHIAQKTHSIAILADSAHYSIDILTNLSIILSLIAIHLWNIYWLDGILAGLVSIYLLVSAFTLGRDATRLLLDKELDKAIREHIAKIVHHHPLSLALHDLRTRDLGGTYMFEFHLELDGNMTLKQAHKHTEEIENMIKKHYPSAQIIIHQEPSGIQDERLDNSLKE